MPDDLPPLVSGRTHRPVGQDPSRFDAAAAERAVTEKERANLLRERLNTRIAELRAEGADEKTARERANREIGEDVGAVTPSAQPGLLEAPVRALLPRTTLAADPRQELIRLARAEVLPDELDAFLADQLHPDTVEALGGSSESLAARREATARARIEELAGAAEFGFAAAKKVPMFLGANIEQVQEKLGFNVVPEELDLLSDETLDRAFPKAAKARSQEPTTAGGAGVPLESPEMALLRFAGTVVPAVVQETGAAVPAPTPLLDDKAATGTDLLEEGGRQLLEGGNPAAVLNDLYKRTGVGFRPVEEIVLGTSPEDRGLLADTSVHGRNWLSRAWLRAMHKTEQGFGAAEDLEGAFLAQARKDGLDPDDKRVQQGASIAWGIGLGADILVPWELPATKALKMAKAAKGLTRLTGVDAGTALALVMKNNRLEAPRVQADVVAGRLEAGERIEDILGTMPDDLAREVRTLFDEVALGTPGPALPPAPGPAPFPGRTPATAATVTPSAQTARPLAARRTQVLPGSPRAVTQADPALARTVAPDDLELPAPSTPKAKIEQASSQLEGRARGLLQEADDDLVRQLLEANADNLLKVSSMDEWRQARKMMQQAMAKGVPLEERRILDGFRGRQGEAAEVMKWMEPNRTPDTPEYRLLGRDETGQVKTVWQGDLQGALARMLNRQRVDDVVMFRDTRDVAGWRKRASTKKDGSVRPQGLLVADHNFSALDEFQVIGDLAKRHPKAQISPEDLVKQGALRQNGFGLPDGELGQAARNFATTMMGLQARRPVRKLDPQQQLFTKAVEDALRARVRSTYGKEDLVNTAGAAITRKEYDGILARLKAATRATGWDPQTLATRVRDGQVKLTKREKLGLIKYARRFGVRVNVQDVMPITDLTQMQTEIVRSLAGASTDARLAIGQTGDLSNNIMAFLNNVVGGKRPGELLRATADGGPKRILDNMIRRRGLTHAAQQVLDAGLARLNGSGREVLKDMQDAIRAGDTPTEALQRVLKDYRPVGEAELLLLDQLRRSPPVTTAQVYIARKHLRPYSSDIPQLRSNDVRVVRHGLTILQQKRNAQLVHLGRRVLESAAPRGGGALPNLVRDSNKVNPAQLRQIWADFLVDGFDAPSIDEGLRDVYGSKMQGGKRPSTQDQHIALAMNLKADEVMKEVATELLEAEVGIADPRMRDAVKHLMLDPSAPSEFTLPELDQAFLYLRRMGIDPGVDVPLEKFADTVLPAGIVEELRQARNAGINLDDKALTSRAFRAMMGTHKSLLTAYNVAYHVTNILGLPFIALQNMGLRKSLSTGRMLGKHPSMVVELSKRLSSGLRHRPSTPDGAVFVTQDGRMYSVDHLEREMTRRDVGVSLQTASNARALSQDMDRAVGLWSPLRDKLSNANDVIVGVTDQVERQFRIGVFLDALDQGSDFNEAAGKARRSLHDYNDLTPFDKKVTRNAIMFAAFHRKNAESFMRALADSPERLGAQLRFAQGLREVQSSDDINMSDSELAAVVLGEMDGIDKSTYRVSTGSLNSAAEGMFLWRNLMGVLQRDPDAVQELAGQANPLIQAGAVLGFDLNLGNGFRATTPGGNAIPAYLVDGGGPWVRDFFGAEPQSLRPEQALERGELSLAGEPKRWESVTEEGQRRWQMAKLAAGRQLESSVPEILQAIGSVMRLGGLPDDAVSFQQPSPHGSTFLDLLDVGFGVRKVQRPEDQLNEARAEQARALIKPAIRTSRREAQVE